MADHFGYTLRKGVAFGMQCPARALNPRFCQSVRAVALVRKLFLTANNHQLMTDYLGRPLRLGVACGGPKPTGASLRIEAG